MKEGKAPRSEACLGTNKFTDFETSWIVSDIFGDEACMVSVLFFFLLKSKIEAPLRCFLWRIWDVRCFSILVLSSSEEAVEFHSEIREAHIPDADFSIILSAEKMLKRRGPAVPQQVVN